MNIYALLGVLGLGYAPISNEVEIDPGELAEFWSAYDLADEPETALDWGFDWDYLYQIGDMVEDEQGRVGIIQFLTTENDSPYVDKERYYCVKGLRGEYIDYLLPDQIRYAVGR